MSGAESSVLTLRRNNYRNRILAIIRSNDNVSRHDIKHGDSLKSGRGDFIQAVNAVSDIIGGDLSVLGMSAITKHTFREIRKFANWLGKRQVILGMFSLLS